MIRAKRRLRAVVLGACVMTGLGSVSIGTAATPASGDIAVQNVMKSEISSTISQDAYDSVIVSYEGKPLFDIAFFHANDEGYTAFREQMRGYDMSIPDKQSVLTYTLAKPSRQSIEDGLRYIADMVGPQKTSDEAIPILVVTDNVANASALTLGRGALVDMLYKGQLKEAKPIITNITVGKWIKDKPLEGFSNTPFTVLPRGGAMADLPAIITHELFHGLGFLNIYNSLPDGNELPAIRDDKFYRYEMIKGVIEDYEKYGIYEGILEADISKFAQHFRDANNRPIQLIDDVDKPLNRYMMAAHAKPIEDTGAIRFGISSEALASEFDALSLSKIFAVTGGDFVIYETEGLTADTLEERTRLFEAKVKERYPDKQVKIFVSGYYDKEAKEEQHYIVSAFVSDPSKSAQSNIYFVGDHVLEVLNGAHIGENPEREGLPINGWEPRMIDSGIKIVIPEDTKWREGLPWLGLDASHDLSLQSAMSHHNYCNWGVFNEVVLAAMQDSGMQFDRKQYFGKSYYGSGITAVNLDGYSARNAAGTAYLLGVPNQTIGGVGLHIYGSQNHITQQGDILSDGSGAAGIRVDGHDNTLIVPKGTKVLLNGINGDGIAIAYGSGHRVVLDGTVLSNGAGGIGLRMDFGSNTLGNAIEMRGSYIDTKVERTKKEGKTTESIVPMPEYLAEHNDGALVKSAVISGTVGGQQDAIYISENALVDDIVIRPGAYILGRITSDWGNLKQLAYAASGDASLALPKEMVANIKKHNTTLRFQGAHTYGGAITGPYSLDLMIEGVPSVYSNTNDTKLLAYEQGMNYTGIADVRSVIVADSGVLRGGAYRNSQGSDTLPIDRMFFVNKGVIGPRTPLTKTEMMTIGGALDSRTGQLLFTANQDTIGQLNVDDTAHVDGARLVIDPAGIYKTNHTYTDFVQAKSFVGKENTTPIIEADRFLTAIYTSNEAAHNSLVDTTRVPNADSMLGTAGDMYNLEAAPLQSMGSLTIQPRSPQALTAVLTRQEQQVYGALYDASFLENRDGSVYDPIFNGRLLENRVVLDSMYSGLMADGGNIRLLDTTVTEALHRHIRGIGSREIQSWGFIDKSWGRLYGTAGLSNSDTRDFTVVAGVDKPVSDEWTVGGLVGFTDTTLSHAYGSLRGHDYSFGAYADYNPSEGKHFTLYTTYGFGDNRINRRILGNSYFAPSFNGERRGDYSSRLWTVGTRYTTVSPTKAVTYRPYVGIDYALYTAGSYGESGADGYAMRADGHHSSLTSAVAGVSLHKDAGDGVFYGGELQYRRVLSGDGVALTGHYGAGSFTMRGHEIGKNRILLSAELGQKLSETATIKAMVTYEKAAGGQEKSASVETTWKF